MKTTKNYKFLFLVATVLTCLASAQLSIDVVHTEKFQEFYGCGASWTDSSAWLMYGERKNPGDPRALTESGRNAIYSDLFGTHGISLKIIRQPMGTSDFRQTADYTYEDLEGSFSIANDESYIIPAVERTKHENSNVKVLALPWSPPAWMKQNNALGGGHLKSDAYDSLAQYFADFVQSYSNVGIPIWAVSVQNEPDHGVSGYPTMKMTPDEHAQAIIAIRKALPSTVRVVGYDHNW